ncbi:ABC transporter ATP-binding protein/permease [Streptomyces sp. LP05-1]|uniref:ABC transporter ATP-binding protein/permease n=1 Tax=Streptomyces pyxinae TaxID=2970734 RepID=A0ABT2CBM4_9ACTN|nr:ABC transporter ATP-binding protein [Streptomyces sp. LP05-1]MCS0634805.1 ABC transporter ATP-binding protein/permease [Streptomyces sp. LP05-1]
MTATVPKAAAREPGAPAPEAATPPPVTTREAWRLLAGCLRSSGGALTLAVAGGLVYQLALIALPWFIERAVDQGIVRDDPGALRTWAVAVLVAGVLAALAEMVLGWYSTLAATAQGNRLYLALADRVAGLSAREAARFGEGDLGLRGTRDIDLVRGWLSGVGSFVTGVLGLTAILVAITRLDPLLALVCVGCVPPLVWINTYWFPKRFGAANTELSAAHGERADAVEELLSASAAVRGLGGEPALVRRHHDRSATVTDHTLRTARVSADWAALSPFVPALAVGAGLGLGGLAVLRGSMSVGGIVAFTSWMSMLVLWVGVLTLRLSQLSQAATAARRLQEVLLPRPGDAPPPAGATALPATGTLTAEGLTLEAGGRPLLGPLDLTARPGELLVVTGPMASGKTSLLRALAQLAEPAAGTVRFAGVPLTGAAPEAVHAALGHVPQRPVTLSGTLADNLRLGGDHDTAALRDACRVAALDGCLDTLPDGLDTPVGERGSTLSGGQLQRLALARAVLRRPAVLLLDDVTSAVDPATERLILDRLRAWAGETALVWATHREAVIAAADHVLRLEPADTTKERMTTGG